MISPSEENTNQTDSASLDAIRDTSGKVVEPLLSETTIQRRIRHPYAVAIQEFLRIRIATFGLVIILILAFLAIFADLIAPYGFAEINPKESHQPPSAEHLMGTDKFGRDVFSRVLYGGRISLRIGLIATAIGGGIGLILGMAAGYAGGWIEEIIMRVMDIMLAFPGILLAMAIVAMTGVSLTNLMVAVGISSVPGYARLIRSTVLSVKEEDYVLASRATGSRDLGIVFYHILPNIAAPLIVYFTLSVATAILSAASLSFLGLGAKPPTPEWGIMLSDGRETLRKAWWVSLYPGLAITLTSLSINFIGDGLRMALDPHIRES